jgi:hypothetical protein
VAVELLGLYLGSDHVLDKPQTSRSL